MKTKEELKEQITKKLTDIDFDSFTITAEQLTLEKLKSRLNKMKKDLGLAESIDILTFLEEVIYVLNHSGEILGYATMGEEIKTDYGYVCSFFSGVEEVLLKRNK